MPTQSDNVTPIRRDFIGAGGGNGGDMLEARIARLESDVAHIQRDVTDLKQDVRELRKDINTDIRLLLAGMIGGFLGMAALLAKGFHWI